MANAGASLPSRRARGVCGAGPPRLGLVPSESTKVVRTAAAGQVGARAACTQRDLVRPLAPGQRDVTVEHRLASFQFNSRLVCHQLRGFEETLDFVAWRHPTRLLRDGGAGVLPSGTGTRPRHGPARRVVAASEDQRRPTTGRGGASGWFRTRKGKAGQSRPSRASTSSHSVCADALRVAPMQQIPVFSRHGCIASSWVGLKKKIDLSARSLRGRQRAARRRLHIAYPRLGGRMSVKPQHSRLPPQRKYFCHPTPPCAAQGGTQWHTAAGAGPEACRHATPKEK